MKRFDVTYQAESKERVSSYTIESAALHAHNRAFREGLKVLSVIEVPAAAEIPLRDITPPV